MVHVKINSYYVFYVLQVEVMWRSGVFYGFHTELSELRWFLFVFIALYDVISNVGNTECVLRVSVSLLPNIRTNYC